MREANSNRVCIHMWVEAAITVASGVRKAIISEKFQSDL